MKKNIYYTLFSVFVFIQSTIVQAQEAPKESLSLEQAFVLALKNNKTIKVEERRVSITQEKVSLGNAGLLPTVKLIGEASYTNNESELTIRTFQPPPNPMTVNFDESGVASTTLSGIIQAEYTIFAGFSGKYRYKLLKKQNKVAQYQQKISVDNTILNVTRLFLEIAKLQQRQELLEEIILIERNRMERINDKKLFGQATGLDVLRAKSNFNRDKSALDALLLSKNSLLRNLNFLIGYEPNRTYRVNAIYTINTLEDLEMIKADVLANNPKLKLANEGVLISDDQVELARSQEFPRLDMFANYGYFNQNNDLQQLAEITNLGYTVGGRISFNIFNGGKVKTNIKVAKLRKEESQLQKEQLSDRLITEAITELNRISILKDQLKREEENLTSFQEAYTRTEERFKNGNATNLVLRDAQTALFNAQITIAELQIDLIRSNITLSTLRGKI